MNVSQSESSPRNGKHDNNEKLKAKLRSILQNVTSQESALQSKTTHLGAWLNMHTTVLSKTVDIKQRLLDFQRFNDNDDDEETRKSRDDAKYAINLALDELAQQLQNLSKSEPKYRSKACFDELEEQKNIITKLKQKNKALSQHNKSVLDQLNKMKESNHSNSSSNGKGSIDSISITEYESKIESLRMEHQQAMERKVVEFENEQQQNRLDLMAQIESLKDDHVAMEQQLKDKGDILINYVERDKEHQTMRAQWESEKKRFTETIEEMKESTVKLTETLLTQRNENQQLQKSAVRHSLAVIQESEERDKLNARIEELEAIQLAQSTKMESVRRKYTDLRTVHNTVNQEKLALIKEVKRCRSMVTDHENRIKAEQQEHSQKEGVFKAQIESLNVEIESLSKAHGEITNRFKEIIRLLADCNSSIESFGDTMTNFSVNGLRESYDSEYEARAKSTKLLDEALSENVNAEIIRLHQEINFGKIRDELEEIETNEAPLKSLFDESEDQIGYIRLSAMKLLMEWMESIKRCNAMYLEYNEEPQEMKDERARDGDNGNGDGAPPMYQYVTSGVSAMATMVYPFSWKSDGTKNENDGGGGGGEREEEHEKKKRMDDEDDSGDLQNGAKADTESPKRENVDLKRLGIESVAKSGFLSVDDAIQIDDGDGPHPVVIEVDAVDQVDGDEEDAEIDVEATLKAKEVEDVDIESSGADHDDDSV